MAVPTDVYKPDFQLPRPLTAEPPLGEQTPLTSEPPLSDGPALTSETTAELELVEL